VSTFVLSKQKQRRESSDKQNEKNISIIRKLRHDGTSEFISPYHLVKLNER
jgi:hypothetical protein